MHIKAHGHGTYRDMHVKAHTMPYDRADTIGTSRQQVSDCALRVMLNAYTQLKAFETHIVRYSEFFCLICSHQVEGG